MEPIVLLKEVDTYYLTFEVHFTIEFDDPMESLIAQSNVLMVIGQLFPTKKEEESSPSESEDSSQSLPSENAGKLTRNQIEKLIGNGSPGERAINAAIDPFQLSPR